MLKHICAVAFLGGNVFSLYVICTRTVGIATDILKQSTHFFAESFCNHLCVADGHRTETDAQVNDSRNNSVENVVKIKTPYLFACFEAVADIKS